MMDVIITGSTGGIGACLVNQMLSNEYINRIYCQFRDKKKFDKIFQNITSKIIMEERTKEPLEDIERLISDLKKNNSQNIICIFTAFSILPIKRVGRFSKEELQENLDINLTELSMMINALVNYKTDFGIKLKLINFDSGAAYKPLEGWSLYSASKAYTNMFLRSVQLENPDIKIVSYEPGVVNTSMQSKIRKVGKEIFGDVDTFKQYYRDGVLKEPDVIAKDVIKRFVLGWDTDDIFARHM